MKNSFFMNMFLMGMINSALCGTLLCMDAKKQIVQNFLESNGSRRELVNGVVQLPQKLQKAIYNTCGSRVYGKKKSFWHKKDDFFYRSMVDDVIVDGGTSQLIVAINDIYSKKTAIESRYLQRNVKGVDTIDCTDLYRTIEYKAVNLASVCFDDEKKELFVGLRDVKNKKSYVEILDVKKWKQSSVFSFADLLVSDICVAKQSKDVVVSFEDGVVDIIDRSTGNRHQQFQYPDGVLTSYLNNTETLLVAVTPHCVYVSDVITGQQVRVVEFGCVGALQAAFLCNNDTQLCVVTYRSVYMYNIKQQTIGTVYLKDQLISQALLSADETQLLVATGNGVFLYDVQTGHMRCHLDHDNFITAVCFGQNDGEFVTVMVNCVRRWEGFYKYSSEQGQFLELLGVWSLLEKPSKKIVTSLMLRSSIIDTLQLDKKNFTTIWKSFPLFVRRMIWGKMDKFIRKYGK